MEGRAVWKFARISPRKVRLIADEIRGKDFNSAFNIVKFTNKKAAAMVEMVLKSALANIEAKEEEPCDVNKLFVKLIQVDNGPMLKRFRPRAMGRAFRIRKRTSHITIVIADSDSAN
ncbi:MAG: 50S ribosomal protein L22 [Candidatus Auribacterota bacterium]|jgi:large subunit ribosomal protein L22|nr:50S ribosomal protein L22 [Candidatus Auribacterota bacterium]